MTAAVADDLAELLGEVPVVSPARGDRASTGAGADMAFGAYEGADRVMKHVSWDPRIRPADGDILPEKKTLDARARDMLRNDPAVAGGAEIHKDSIVGSLFLLNAKPATRVLFAREDEAWEAAFQDEVESKFTLWAESANCWVDATRQNTLTELVRLGVGMFTSYGEVLGSTEWMPADGRPFQSALMMIDPDRLQNPNGSWDPKIRGGVERDRRGAPIAYHVLNRHPADRFGSVALQTTRVMARDPRGRPRILHIFEQLRPDQSRGVAAMASALSELRLLQKFRLVEIERAVAASTYAMSIETAMLPAEAYSALGADSTNPHLRAVEEHLAAMTDFASGAKNLHVDGVKIPILPMGSSLKLQNPGNSSPLGADMETSLLRRIAAALGISYEELSRDFSKTNYSSARAAMGITMLHMQSLKRRVAERIAFYVYRLWFEEAVNIGALDCMKGAKPSIYEGLNLDAYLQCDWIGAGQGQMDPLKETQAAALRMRSGLSTLEIENSKIHGTDWRKVMRQQAREKAMAEELDIPSVYTLEPSDAENAATGEPRSAQE